MTRAKPRVPKQPGPKPGRKDRFQYPLDLVEDFLWPLSKRLEELGARPVPRHPDGRFAWDRHGRDIDETITVPARLIDAAMTNLREHETRLSGEAVALRVAVAMAGSYVLQDGMSRNAAAKKVAGFDPGGPITFTAIRRELNRYLAKYPEGASLFRS